MKAAVVHEYGAPLHVEEVATPDPGPAEVLVKVETSGLCHTDIHAAHGDWPVKPPLPLIPGHEGVGIVTRVGSGVTRVSEGDRVAVPWLGWACGECEACTSGWETLCEQQRNTGYSVAGGYAEYVLGSAAFVGRVPAAVDPLDAAPLTCAGVTTYKAVKVSGTRPSDLVAIFGVGGLGHLALQYARVAGATVVAVDVTDDKLQLAKELGASYTVNAMTEDPDRGDPGARRSRRRDRAGGGAEAVRASVRIASTGRPARARWPARGERAAAADLPDRAQGHHGHRLDRRHAGGSGRDVRAAQRTGTRR